MKPFKQDNEITPVLFRVSRSPKKYGDDVTAVFPCEPGDYSGHNMTCYAHIGQHGSCDFGWLHATHMRPATEAQYAELKAELESAPYGYRLKVYKKVQPWMRNKFSVALRQANAALKANPAGAPWIPS